MRKLLAAAAVLMVLAGCASLRPQAWTTLIDAGRGIENFTPTGDANWHVQDGALVADRGKGGFLVSHASYRDFVLRAEFWAEATTNSGIFFRVGDRNKIGGAAYEFNIYDQREGPEYGTGAIVNVAKVVPPYPKAAGRWSTVELTVKGADFAVALDGVPVASGRDTKYADGMIALQFGSGPKGAPGGAIKWRTVQIRPL